MKIRRRASVDKVEQQMTPMIDIVFQLLTFFVMSFKIGVQEGDFNIKMPLAGVGVAVDQELPPVKVRLIANKDGSLGGIRMGDRQLNSFRALHNEVMSIVGSDKILASNVEVELDCDYGLHYDNVVNAISAVSGHLDEASGTVVKLIEKIKFAPPREPAT
jgi:biopolymer transport protein ExbD